ncbi:MAG: family 43 glycosylhydrolase, partial [Oscillospiraceae bacterium]|nr:family 43 glycosylhydrolase [Oscillospiraceae bacterium]
MKRSFSLFCAIVILCAGINLPSAAEIQTRLYGDVDGKNGVDITDARLLLQYLVGKADLDEIQLKAANVKGIGSADITDARLILQYLVGKITGFPVGISFTFGEESPELVITKNTNIGAWGDQGDGTFLNPVLESDYSDPDIVRVGDKFYMITSTFSLAPGMALLESTDLVNWTTINYCIPDMTKFSPDFNWDKMSKYNPSGVFAGSLRYLEYKEDDGTGNLVDKSKWFMHTTLYEYGFVVATADDPYGEWTAQWMKDRQGRDLRATNWDDNCPYWEFNEDGTLKAAYMTASKLRGAWYLHVFQMSLDGTTLLDGDLTYMNQDGDFARQRTGTNGKGTLVSRSTGGILPEGSMDNYIITIDGDLPSVMDAIHIPDREGAVIRDNPSNEASKIIRFGPETDIGKTTFSGRHGDNQKVSDYVYIFFSEQVDGLRIPLLSRAKSIYGDKFDAQGNYIGPGGPADPGVYETQRIMVSLGSAVDRRPNQGGYVDVPAWLSTDGKEHWYWMTHQGDESGGPQARPTSIQEVTWVGGWPLAGIVTGEESRGQPDPAARMYDGTGLNGSTNNSRRHPAATYIPGTFQWGGYKPPIKGVHPITDFQGSDEFDYIQYNDVWKLNPQWQWNFQPRDSFWDLTGDALRLYAFRTADNSDSFFKAGNTVCQRYVNEDYVTAE